MVSGSEQEWVDRINRRDDQLLRDNLYSYRQGLEKSRRML